MCLPPPQCSLFLWKLLLVSCWLVCPTEILVLSLGVLEFFPSSRPVPCAMLTPCQLTLCCCSYIQMDIHTYMCVSLFLRESGPSSALSTGDHLCMWCSCSLRCLPSRRHPWCPPAELHVLILATLSDCLCSLFFPRMVPAVLARLQLSIPRRSRAKRTALYLKENRRVVPILFLCSAAIVPAYYSLFPLPGLCR